MNVTFFESASDFRAWLQEHHASATELWVGFYNKASGKGGLSYPEAVDQALCFGWIDGIRKRVDDASYTNRFSPRKAGSNWSTVNVTRVQQLSAQGLMQPPGLAAYAARDQAKTDRYSYERVMSALDLNDETRFRANESAWAFFQAQSPWYRRVALWWVASAKKPETRQRRLTTLIHDSEQRRRLAAFTSPARR